MYKKLAIKTVIGVSLVFVGVMNLAAANQLPGKGITARPIENTILEEKFQGKIIYRAMEELGYTIAEPEEVKIQIMHISLGAGDADFTTGHWTPLHNAFFEESGGSEKLTKVGSYISGALQGYLVDKASYDAGITNVGMLKDPKIAKRFDSDNDGKADLVGCAPGWGCERVIEHHLKEYELSGTVSHNQGEYNAIIADAIARNQSGESIIYYTWMPYWVSGVLVPGKSVEWLEVPYSSLPDNRKENTEFDGKNLGFTGNNIGILANNTFLDANPAAKKLFEVVRLSIVDVSTQNLKMQNGEDSIADIDRHVEEWIKANRATFDSWLKAARGV